ncbi:hypothetical protein [Caballeronia sp. TF1N1]|uniref:hypothetical protein n=1 Tax=Caballeronia sp. TF1N1 TaxID=2878153 RepID=UPI001FD5F0F3|nr:hypothetical protein [Caballeronia sp. TF1N1]
MQIIIVQTEIEAAIRAHIEQQVSIKEGMEIAIDLRSTRGDVGFTAHIDIVPAKAAKAHRVAPTPAASPAKKEPEAPVPKGNPELSQGKQEQPPVSNVHVQEGAEQFTQEQLAGSTDSGQNTDSTEPTNTAEAGEAAQAGAEPSSTEAEQPAAETKPQGRSLFPNLKRIQNT